MRRFFLAILFLGYLGVAPGVRAARVGVIGAGNAADLLTVELSKQAGIEVLERAQLERITKEMALSLSQAVEAGKLLGADGLVFLEVSGSGTNQVGAVRVVGAKQGVILYSTRLAWPPAGLEEWVRKIAPKVAQAAAKAAVPPEKAVKISVLNLRAAANSAGQQLLERELTALLLSRLAQEPEVFVLERRQLGAAVFEKDLAASEEKFWTGSHLLDGTINRDSFDPKRVTIAARLRGPDGGEAAIEVEGARNELGKVIEDLVSKILKVLKVEKRASWDPAREAGQHLEEAKWALRWKMWREAQAAADSAWALGEQSMEAAATRLFAYGKDLRVNAWGWHFVPQQQLQWPARPPGPEAVEAPRQALLLLREQLARNPNSVTNAQWFQAAREALDNAGETLASYFWRAETRGPAAEKLAELRENCRWAMKNMLSHPQVRRMYWLPAEGGPTGDELSTYYDQRNESGEDSDFFSICLRNASVFYETPEETAAALDILLGGDAFPFIRKNLESERKRSPLLGGWRWADRQRENAVWEKFVTNLNQSTNVFLKLEGLLLVGALESPDQAEMRTPGAREAKIKRITAFLEEHREAFAKAKLPRKIEGADYWKYEQQFAEAKEREAEQRKIAGARTMVAEKTPYDFRKFGEAIHLKYSTNQALEMLDLLKAYRQEVIENMPDRERRGAASFVGMFEQTLHRKAGLAQPPPPPASTNSAIALRPMPPGLSNRMGLPGMRGGPPFRPYGGTNGPAPVETITAPRAMAVREFVKVPEAEVPPHREHGMSPPLLRDGKIWARFYEPLDYAAGRGSSKFIALDGETLRTERVIRFESGDHQGHFRLRSAMMGEGPPRDYEIVGSQLFVLDPEGIMRKGFAEKEWQKFPAPAAGGSLWRVRTNLYLTAPDSLHEIDPATGVARTLASIRRRPAAGPLDNASSLQYLTLAEGPNGSLRAALNENTYLFDGAKWILEAPVANSQWRADGASAFSLPLNAWSVIQFHVLPPGSAAPRLIAVIPKMRPGPRVQTELTNWTFSAVSPRVNQAFMLGANVAVISARGNISPGRNDITEKTSELDLYIFGPAGEKAVQIPLQLDLAKGPGAGQGFLSGVFSPYLAVTDQTLWYGHAQSGGFWKISRGEIDRVIHETLAAKMEAKR